MPTPTFISVNQTVWNDTTSPKSTSSFAVQAGDVLLGLAATSSWQTSDGQTNNPTISDSYGLTWVQQQAIAQDQYCGMVVWTTTVPVTTTLSATFTHVHTNTGIFNGGMVIVIRASDGAGASTSGFGNLVVPELDLTTLYNQSLVVFFSADWNTNTNANRQWLNVNNYVPTSGNGYELVYNVAGSYTIYCAYWPNAGINGTSGFGLLPTETPVLQKSSHTAIEIRGTSDPVDPGGGGVAPDAPGYTGNFSQVNNFISMTL